MRYKKAIILKSITRAKNLISNFNPETHKISNSMTIRGVEVPKCKVFWYIKYIIQKKW